MAAADRPPDVSMYTALIDAFLAGEMTAKEFSLRNIGAQQRDPRFLSDPWYPILNELFYDPCAPRPTSHSSSSLSAADLSVHPDRAGHRADPVDPRGGRLEPAVAAPTSTSAICLLTAVGWSPVAVAASGHTRTR